MSTLAKDLFELRQLVKDGAGALSQHMLAEVAAALIAEGVADERGGA
jgi:hypothetical protein